MDSTREDLITKMENESITEALKAGFDVVVDATNLNPKTVNRMYKLAEGAGLSKTDIEFKDFYIPFKEAVERDIARGEAGGHSVGEKVLKRFYRQYYSDQYEKEMGQTIERYRIPINYDLKLAIICDLDGTLAWMQGRSPFNYNKVNEDKIDERLRHILLQYVGNRYRILFVSGREGTDECREKTLNWLEEKIMSNDQNWFTLFMRKKGDYRPDEVIKKEIYEQYIKDQYDVMCVFDDRQKVVDMWREQGLLCCQVAKGDF